MDNEQQYINVDISQKKKNCLEQKKIAEENLKILNKNYNTLSKKDQDERKEEYEAHRDMYLATIEQCNQILEQEQEQIDGFILTGGMMEKQEEDFQIVEFQKNKDCKEQLHNARERLIALRYRFNNNKITKEEYDANKEMLKKTIESCEAELQGYELIGNKYYKLYIKYKNKYINLKNKL